MKRLRTISTRRLLVVVGAIVVLAITAGIAQGALSSSNPTPAAKPLDRAVLDAVNAPKVDGLTASITFSNNLIPAGSLPEGSTSPLLSGAKGRLWVTNDGRARLELQSASGDAEIVSDGKQVTVYDANSNTVYRFDLPQGHDKSGADQGKEHKPVTLEQVDKAINEFSKHWSLSGANPTSTAGAPTYTVRISPRDDGGLLGGAELAWDATNGIPLRAAVYADNQSSPVLELKATDVSFAKVPNSDVNISPPAGARVVDMSSRQPQSRDQSGAPQKIEGVDAVQSKLDFKLVAPDALAGLPLQNVRLVQHENQAGAVAVYGKGLGAIVVLQNKAGNGQNGTNPGGGGDREHNLRLPQININGATGTELATALGTVVTFERNGISYTVAGSVPPQAAEQAARELQ
jgi:outer membrane lipoprotein-sorting protein